MAHYRESGNLVHKHWQLGDIMRVSDKLALIDKIGRELQQKFSYAEIDEFLGEFEILPPQDVSVNSKWVYSKAALRGVSNNTLLKIADELDIDALKTGVVTSIVPRNWKDNSDFRLFVSHISKDKDKAMRLKECLASYGISGFVAHEDILPTLEWQKEIERALYTMDAFLAIHTPGFSKSVWTQQEIGIAVGRRTKIISLKMGEDPTGFISHQQALSRKNRTAEVIAKEINDILATDDVSSAKLAVAKKSNSWLDDEIPF